MDTFADIQLPKQKYSGYLHYYSFIVADNHVFITPALNASNCVPVNSLHTSSKVATELNRLQQKVDDLSVAEDDFTEWKAQKIILHTGPYIGIFVLIFAIAFLYYKLKPRKNKIDHSLFFKDIL